MNAHLPFYSALALFVVPSALAAQSGFGILDANDVQMRVFSNGAIGPDLSGDSFAFLVPASEGTSTMYTAGLWLGGITPSNQTMLATHSYDDADHGFYPGPLTIDGSASISIEVMQQYDQVWKIEQADIAAHQAYFDCVSDPNCNEAIEYPNGYVMPPSFINWPAHGDVQFDQALHLAPFFDHDNDGIYDPYSGDRPCVPGDQALYAIFNDKGPPGGSGAQTGIEIHMMPFVYTGHPMLEQTVFVHYKLINRGTQTLMDHYIANFADLDIGCPDDDRIGTDVGRDLVFASNATNNDESCLGIAGYGQQPPAFGVTILKGPLIDFDGMDNAYEGSLPAFNGRGFADGVIDNERHGLSRSMYFLREGDMNMTNPVMAPQFYNYLRSVWKNNLPVTYGGTGYSFDPNAPQTRYVFPGNSDPLGVGTNNIPQTSWNMGAGNDGRALATMGPMTLEPGVVQEFVVAYVYARAASGGTSASVSALKQRVDSVRGFAENIPGILAGGTICDQMPVGIAQERAEQNSIELFPNPASDQLNLRMHNSFGNAAIEIFDARGRLVMTKWATGTKMTIDIQSLDRGLYHVRLVNEENASTGRFMKM